MRSVRDAGGGRGCVMSAAPAAPVSETDLFDGYRTDPAVLELRNAGQKERRPCMCRGVVEADPCDPMLGVAWHNETFLHRRWRQETGKL